MGIISRLKYGIGLLAVGVFLVSQAFQGRDFGWLSLFGGGFLGLIGLIILAGFFVKDNGEEGGEHVPLVGSGDKLMEMAFQYARASVPVMLDMVDKLDVDKYNIKVPVEDDKGMVEHFWLSGCSYEDGEFIGTIDNEPKYVDNVSAGEQVAIPAEDISDWMFVANGRIWGNLTLRAMLPGFSKSQQKEYIPKLQPMEEFDNAIGIRVT